MFQQSAPLYKYGSQFDEVKLAWGKLIDFDYKIPPSLLNMSFHIDQTDLQGTSTE